MLLLMCQGQSMLAFARGTDLFLVVGSACKSPRYHERCFNAILLSMLSEYGVHSLLTVLLRIASSSWGRGVGGVFARP